MRRILAVVVLACGLLLGVGARPSYACSCGSDGTFAQDVAASDAVFVATTIAVEEHFTEPTPDGGVALLGSTVAMEVLRVHRGEFPARVTVQTTGGGSMCGYGFVPGRTEVVFGHRQGDELFVSSCSRTIPLAQLPPADQAALGPARAPLGAGQEDRAGPFDAEVREALAAGESEGFAALRWLTPTVGWGVLAGFAVLAVGATVLARGRRAD